MYFSLVPSLRWLSITLLALACSLALALPSPKDISAAVEAGDLARAETMLHEVLKEKPNSAKAHYELGEVLARAKRYDEALAQLNQARAIDPALKFASSPDKFSQTVDKVSAAAAAAKTAATSQNLNPAPAAAPAHSAVAPAASASSFPTGYVVGGIILLVLLFVLIRRSQAPRPTPMPIGAYPGAPGYAPGGAMAPAPYGGYGAQPQAGSGIGGAVLGGVAGLAAGYALSKAMEGGNANAGQAQHAAAANEGYVPFDTPPAPDMGSFDAGSGSGWDAADSGGGDSGGDW
jgi:tetratricopeptide (TPR) repeat protein